MIKQKIIKEISDKMKAILIKNKNIPFRDAKAIWEKVVSEVCEENNFNGVLDITLIYPYPKMKNEKITYTREVLTNIIQPILTNQNK